MVNIAKKHLIGKSNLKNNFLSYKKDQRFAGLVIHLMYGGDGGTWSSMLSSWHWLYLEPVVIRSSGVLCESYITFLKGWNSHPSTTMKAAYKSIHGCWITPHTARHCLIASLSDLGFTDKAGFSLVCCHTRRLITNRTHVQKHRHLSFYECSRHIRDSLSPMPVDRRPVS